MKVTNIMNFPKVAPYLHECFDSYVINKIMNYVYFEEWREKMALVNEDVIWNSYWYQDFICDWKIFHTSRRISPLVIAPLVIAPYLTARWKMNKNILI